MGAFDHLETPLVEAPLFPCEAVPEKPADKKKWSEEYRQSAFVTWMRKNHPELITSSVTNEGVRSVFGGVRMKRKGLLPGYPDIIVLWPDGWAFIEFKGFDARGQAGKLSPAQIATCNRIHRMGHPVAMFYGAQAAVDWLRSVGAPIRGRVA